jgi:hypothetical protein
MLSNLFQLESLFTLMDPTVLYSNQNPFAVRLSIKFTKTLVEVWSRGAVLGMYINYILFIYVHFTEA